MPPVLSVQACSHAYGRHEVVRELSLSLKRGMIACLLGPSGCGKTTVLRCVAGFEPLTSGEIRIDDRVVSSPGHRIPTEQRNVGIVFQDYALFPHLDVASNVGFGLARWSSTDRRNRVAEMLALVGLEDVGSRYPHEISGGQQQRVALARALAPRPNVLLLDEPFSNLDVELRERLSVEVRELLKRQGTTALLVTHDQREAFAMADEIGVMQGGRLHQWADAFTLYHRPATRFVADFVGQGAFVPGNLAPDGWLQTELAACEPDESIATGYETYDVLLRPEDVLVDPGSPLQARILTRTFRGADILYSLETPKGLRLLCASPGREPAEPGDRLGIRLRDGRFVAFPKE